MLKFSNYIEPIDHFMYAVSELIQDYKNFLTRMSTVFQSDDEEKKSAKDALQDILNKLQAFYKHPKIFERKDALGNTILHIIALSNRVELVAELLEKTNLLHIVNSLNLTPAATAALSNSLECLRAFYEKDTTILDYQRVSDGQNLLHLSSTKGHAAVAEFLIATNKIDINAVCQQGKTALHYAMLEDKFERGSKLTTVKTLLDAKARIDIKDKDTLTPVHIAVINANLSYLEVLHDANPQIFSDVVREPDKHNRNLLGLSLEIGMNFQYYSRCSPISFEDFKTRSIGVIQFLILNTGVMVNDKANEMAEKYQINVELIYRKRKKIAKKNNNIPDSLKQLPNPQNDQGSKSPPPRLSDNLENHVLPPIASEPSLPLDEKKPKNNDIKKENHHVLLDACRKITDILRLPGDKTTLAEHCSQFSKQEVTIFKSWLKQVYDVKTDTWEPPWGLHDVLINFFAAIEFLTKNEDSLILSQLSTMTHGHQIYQLIEGAKKWQLGKWRLNHQQQNNPAQKSDSKNWRRKSVVITPDPQPSFKKIEDDQPQPKQGFENTRRLKR